VRSANVKEKNCLPGAALNAKKGRTIGVVTSKRGGSSLTQHHHRGTILTKKGGKKGANT